MNGKEEIIFSRGSVKRKRKKMPRNKRILIYMYDMNFLRILMTIAYHMEI